METLNVKIEQLCQLRESTEVEFKSAKGGFPGSFWETFSAFANTNGGMIVLGVKEKDGHFIPDGLDAEAVDKYRKQFWNEAHNKSRVSAALLVEGDIELFECKQSNHQILIFHIPRAPYDVRPVYLTQNPFGNTYKRCHEGDYRCSNQQVRRMFADADHALHPADARILPGYSMDDLDMPTLAQYRQRFRLRQENHAWNALSDIEFLKRLGAYRIDRETSEEGFTIAGLLMFGKTESITDGACCPWYFVDYREVLTSDADERWTNRVYPDGNWSANLYQFFYRVYPLITQMLSVPFRLEGVERVEETSLHKAVREALVNTLVHADYQQRGNIVVIRKLNELIFKNPGTLLISIEDYYEGGYSVCRNPNLQKMFMMLGGGERAGSGTDTIVRGCADYHWALPVLQEDTRKDMVVLSLKFETVQASAETVQASDGSVQASAETVQASGGSVQASAETVQASGGSVQASKRARIEQEILSFCAEPRSLAEIAIKLGVQHKQYLKNTYINPLLGHVLELTHPENPRHMHQRYRTIVKS